MEYQASNRHKKIKDARHLLGKTSYWLLFSSQKLYFCPNFNQNIYKMSDFESKIIKIIVDKLGVDESEVTPEASFTNDLGADSLDTVELIMEFEKEFNLSIPDDEAEKIQTVGNAFEYLNTKMNAAG